MKTSAFNELLKSIKQAGAIIRGERKPSRITVTASGQVFRTTRDVFFAPLSTAATPDIGE